MNTKKHHEEPNRFVPTSHFRTVPELVLTVQYAYVSVRTVLERFQNGSNSQLERSSTQDLLDSVRLEVRVKESSLAILAQG